VLQPFALITFHERGVAYEARGKHLQTLLPRAYQLEGAISAHLNENALEWLSTLQFQIKIPTANYYETKKNRCVKKLSLSQIQFFLSAPELVCG